VLIIHADDFGRSVQETDAALRCFDAGRISSASLMVFMRDSERAARLAHASNLSVGLHLNFTDPFTSDACGADVVRSQARLSAYLRRHRYTQLVYNPLLKNDFARSYAAQTLEFTRLFGGIPPSHVDGHHHMHLCTNLLLSRLIPANTRMRGSFSFLPGEKSWCNRFYRSNVNRWLSRQHRLPEFFFDLSQSLQMQRLNRALSLAKTATVELMTHPIFDRESDFLLGEPFGTALRNVNIGSYKDL
jgi:predicted glycoside hydrolase/deacetylase ChbG (UPF0249 family)